MLGGRRRSWSSVPSGPSKFTVPARVLSGMRVRRPFISTPRIIIIQLPLSNRSPVRRPLRNPPGRIAVVIDERHIFLAVTITDLQQIIAAGNGLNWTPVHINIPLDRARLTTLEDATNRG